MAQVKKALVFYLMSLGTLLSAQIDTVIFEPAGSLLFPAFPYKSSYASVLDRNGQPYLYSANMEFGLGIYRVAEDGAITLVRDMGIQHFHNLDVAAVKQRGSSLFLGLGDFHVNDNSASGLAILDVSDPETPSLKGIWDSTLFKHGVYQLEIAGDFAYLSSMSDGIVILNISDEEHISFTSSLALDLSFPAPSGNAHNARGLKLRNDTLFVAFDRGGLRVVDVADKSTPLEVYKYINGDLNNSASAAYNDVFLKGNKAYCSVDYCGMEVIDISQAPFQSLQWYDPWHCNFINWSGAEIHTNEIKTAHGDSLLFLAAGRTELLVFDISATPARLAGRIAHPEDTLATHAVDVLGDRVSLSFLRTPFHIPPFTPFYAEPGGLKVFDYFNDYQSSETGEVTDVAKGIALFPNPAKDFLVVESPLPVSAFMVSDARGVPYANAAFEAPVNNFEINTKGWPAGLYGVSIYTAKGFVNRRLLVIK